MNNCVKKIMVSVVVITYNQQKYIRQAIDSILQQKVGFPIEILVGDDCSGDKTPAIVRSYKEKYPGLFYIQCRTENVGSTRNSYELYMQARGKYIANLEGDDFWTDLKKLQKQVDFLEENPEYSCCTCDFTVVNDKGVPLDGLKDAQVKKGAFSNKKIYTLAEFNQSLMPSHPGTWVFRNIFLTDSGCDILYKAHSIVGDVTIAMLLLAHGNIYKMSDKMSAYRRAPASGMSWTAYTADNPFHYYELFKYHNVLEQYAVHKLKFPVDLSKRKKFEFYHMADHFFRDPRRAKWKCLCSMIMLTTHKMQYVSILFKALYLAMVPAVIRNMHVLAEHDDLYEKFQGHWSNFWKDIKGKRLVLYGAGGGCEDLIYQYYDLLPIEFVVDKNKSAQGNYIKGFKIYGIDKLKEIDSKQLVVLITSGMYYIDIAKQLESMGICHYYAYPVMERQGWRYKLLKYLKKDMYYMQDLK